MNFQDDTLLYDSFDSITDINSLPAYNPIYSSSKYNHILEEEITGKAKDPFGDF